MKRNATAGKEEQKMMIRSDDNDVDDEDEDEEEEDEDEDDKEEEQRRRTRKLTSERHADVSLTCFISRFSLFSGKPSTFHLWHA